MSVRVDGQTEESITAGERNPWAGSGNEKKNNLGAAHEVQQCRTSWERSIQTGEYDVTVQRSKSMTDSDREASMHIRGTFILETKMLVTS